MIENEIFGRLTQLKHNVQHFFGESRYFLKEKLHKLREKEVHPIHIDNYHYESHHIDDLPLTLNKDPSPGVRFYSTENSEAARGAEKADAHGIDSFGEKDTFDIEEADDYQDFRNRNQNSDLSQRFYTRGLKSDDLH
jgi:hypothetical protein